MINTLIKLNTKLGTISFMNGSSYFPYTHFLSCFGYILICMVLSCTAKENKGADVESITFLKHLNVDIKQSPKNDTLVLHRAKLLMEQNYISLAYDDCERAWNIRPTVAAALCKYQAYIAQKEYSSCLSWLRTCLSTLDSSADIAYALANTYLLNNEKKQALHILEKIKHKALSFELAFDIGSILMDANANQEALFFIDKALEQQNNNEEALLTKAYLMIQLDLPQTLHFLDQLAHHRFEEDKMADINYLYGEYYLRKKMFLKAISYYDQSTKKDWRFQSAYIGKAQCLREQNKYQQAIEQLTIASQVDKPTFTLMKETAICFLSLKDTTNAIEYFVAARQIDSADMEVNTQLGFLKNK